MKKVYALLLLLCPVYAMAQNINTTAGNGIAGFTGDGVPAAGSELNLPKAAFVDDTGNVYIADAYNNRIRKVNLSGIISTVAGSGVMGYSGDTGPAVFAQLGHPNSVAVDPTGNIYICDADNHAIRKVDVSGTITTIVGDGIPGYTGDGAAATPAEINFPAAIALDVAGNLYIADQGNNVIRKVNTSGIISTFAGTGATGYAGEGGAATAADIGFPYGVATDGAGNVYVSLYFDNRVLKINSSGIVTTLAGNGTPGFIGDGGPATAALMEGPWGIASDAAGNVYIADNVNQRIRHVDPFGTITTVAGNGSSGYTGDGVPATSTRLRDPVGVAAWHGGSIYIADYNNQRLRKVDNAFTHAPAFSGGHTQTLTTCMDVPPIAINSYLVVTDADMGQSESWSVTLAPMHGTLVAAYSVISTGSTLTPTGLTYVPTTGYTGADSFKVKIYDGTATDSTKILVTVNPCPTGLAMVTAGDGFNIFPNPNAGVFTISLPPIQESAHIIITNIVGEKVRELDIATNNRTVIKLNEAPGIYFINAVTAHNNWQNRFVIAGQ